MVENACLKAKAVAGAVVLGVDTTVALGSETLGKPRGEEEARSFLHRLAGRSHRVWSGLCLLAGERERTGAAVTEVRFRSLSEAEIERYVASGEWRERAGGYAIQGRGAALVERISGDFWNVVGLPVPALVELAPELFR